MTSETDLIKENKILKRKLYEAEASMVENSFFAMQYLKKFGRETLLGSAAIIEMSALGNKLTLGPIAIPDGLSKATLESLEADIKRAYEHRLCHHPDGYKEIPEFE